MRLHYSRQRADLRCEQGRLHTDMVFPAFERVFKNPLGFIAFKMSTKKKSPFSGRSGDG